MHSLHAYFLRRGDFNAPIVYQVDRSLDGHSFSNRRVVAIQHGQQIFNMAASFQTQEDGFDHQIGDSRGPRRRRVWVTTPVRRRSSWRALPERVRRFFAQPRPFEFRMVQPIDYLQPQTRAAAAADLVPRRGSVPDSEMLHRRLLAYVSDFFLLDTATLPHGTSFLSPAS